MKKLQLFDQNHVLTPLQKCQFCGFLKPIIFLFRKACLLYKTSKIIFSRFIFTREYGVVTRDYRGLQGVTKGYRQLQGVTRAYRGLQGVTRGYKGLKGVTRGYKG